MSNVMALTVVALLPAIPAFGLGCIVTIVGALIGAIQWAIFWPCVVNTVALSVGFSFFLYVVATCFIVTFISSNLVDNEHALDFYNGPFVDGTLRGGLFLICLKVPFFTASLDGALVHNWPIWQVVAN